MATIRPSFSVDKINQYFKKYRNITFKAGTYNITKMMTVQSDTKITCEPGVLFKRACRYQMLEMAASEDVTEYNGTHNVTWTGGVFQADTVAENAIVIVLYHCRNIILRGITVDGCRGYHSIECNSSAGVVIEDCIFKNQTAIPGADYRETIQIDFAYQLGYPYRGSVNAPANDGTHCRNITIENCAFWDVPNGIGTHTVYEKEKYHENIIINDCRFYDISGYSIQLLSMKNVSICRCSNASVSVQKRNKGYNLQGEKVKLSKTRYNVDVQVDDVFIE